jgi:DNA-binding IclR family transcriptional regulator
MPAKPSYSVPALDKGLDILEALAVAQVPQTLTALSRSLKRTPSELFRMLDVLERRAYISRDAISDAYSLTLKLYELAHTHSPVDQLLRTAAFPMRELAESIRESCHLSILHGAFLMVIAQAESPEPVRLSIEVGYRALPLTTASGKVLVSMFDESEQARFLAIDPTYISMNESGRLNLKSEMSKIRRTGIYIAASTRRTGNDISCVIGNRKVGVVAALGIPLLPGGANEGKERKLAPIVQKCANQITAALGLQSPHSKSA